jgi:hypothetical protein
VLEQARAELAHTERVAEASEDGRNIVRRAILASATVALLLETIAECDEAGRAALIRGYEAGMDGLIRDASAGSRLKWIVLRNYARWKYDDAVQEDWFHRYMHLAKPYIREKVRLSREYLLEAQEGSKRFVEFYDQLLGDLVKDALRTRPKKRFVPPDIG